MWVTQTYLGDVERDAKVFVYYVFEEYAAAQNGFTDQVQTELERLGEVHGPNVSLLMPNPGSAASIESELREKLQGLWWSMAGKLPGLLVCSRPLSKFDPADGDYALLSFATDTPSEAARVITRVRQLLNDQLAWMHANQTPVQPKPIWKRLFDALELKPGAAGIRLDLKKLG